MPPPLASHGFRTRYGAHSRQAQAEADSADSAQRNASGMNRSLPPVPGSVADTYDIPTLRRKRRPTQANSSSPPQHTRSLSHPFPSFFSSRKADKKQAQRHVPRTEDLHDDWGQALPTGTKLPSTLTTGKAALARPDKQPVTGKCMACDSTVRWPQGLKVYRCTTCLTINDLEPYVDSRSEAIWAGDPSRRPMPLSVDRTRVIISHCLSQYLDCLLEEKQARPMPADRAGAERHSSEEIWPQTFYEEDSPPESVRPAFKIRSRSEPASSPVRAGRRDPDYRRPPDSRPGLHDGERSPASRQPTTDVSEAAPVPSNPSKSPPQIFGLLEDYIAASFTGCSALNSAFFTVKPGQEGRSASSPTAPNRKDLESAAPAYEPDGFLSEMDAKTLLIGDFAENGSWWTGGRPDPDPCQQLGEKSPERWKGIVSAKSPRINTAELAEWYRLVINAGESWTRKWHDLRNGLSEDKQQRWQSISLEHIRHEITDAQIHLQRSLLKSTENLLKRPSRPLKHPEDCRFLVMLSLNPLLYAPASPPQPPPLSAPNGARSQAVTVTQDLSAKRSVSRPRRQGSLGLHSGIVKRIIGLLANLPNEVHQFLVSWFSRFADSQFEKLVDLVGGFVTYRLFKQQRRPAPEPINPTSGLVPCFADSGSRHPSQLHAALDMRARGSPATTKASAVKLKLSAYGDDWQVRAAAKVMSLLFQANVGHSTRKRDLTASHEQGIMNAGLNAKYQASAHGAILPISNFYNSLLDYADLVADFEAWEATKTKFTFCQYPFFLSIYAKIHILEHDARRQMEDKAREAFFDTILGRKAVSQYLVLKVRRDCLVEDSLRSVSEVIGAGGEDIKKGLKIDFVDEEGIDAGGLRKEWFLLLTREIFDPNYGLFVYDEDSHYCYFNPFCFESSEQFFLVGVLLGLAIYNSAILDVAFPPFLFKKLLASAPSTGDKLTSTARVSHSYTLEDLAEFRPTLAKGLRQLLEFEGDVQETFCRDFIVEMDKYGEVVQLPLCSGGAKRPVTNSNRRDFVDLYVHYLIDTVVTRQYEPFKRGFFTVCGGNALSLFRPEEIELLVRGSEELLDITSLRAVATYEGWPRDKGPPEQQSQVIWFWEFFQRISPADQRKLLSFITGSDRIPAMGATNLVMKITCLKDNDWRSARGLASAKNNNDKDIERFPIARTCFNMLSLYEYKTRDRLESKLWMAVQGSEGFGLK
ncbi:hypothetical protein DV736_g5931, partial [Chaetothyriales sp. CBS 134916]